MRTKFIHAILLVCISIVSCRPTPASSPLEQALTLAGSNRAELQKVLQHYKEDPLKYQAACFLIENMPYYHSYAGEEIEFDKQYQKALSESNSTPEQITDSLDALKRTLTFTPTILLQDIQTIDSAFLVRNIDFAFRVWREQPWGKNVPFEDFCEYILPYRIGDEPLSDWHKDLYDHFNAWLDSFRIHSPHADNPRAAADVILAKVMHSPRYFTMHPYTKHHIGPDDAYWMSGSCLDISEAFVYICRALAIPCGIDMMIMKGNNNANHHWNFVFDKDSGAYYGSPLYEANYWQSTHNYKEPTGKVYRLTFSLNREMLEEQGADTLKIYPAFRQPHMKDVTAEYANDSTYTLSFSKEELYYTPEDNELLYLCLTNHRAWVPVAWTRYVNGKAVFKNVNGNVVFRLGTYTDNIIRVISDPVAIDSTDIRYITAGKDTEEVKLLQKIHDTFIDRMPGGVFEAANKPDFSDKDTLHLITDKPTRMYNVVYLHHPKRYRYVRYYGPMKGYCDISEVAFYQSQTDSVPLDGRVIGTQAHHIKDQKHNFTNVYDGDPYTSFHYHLPIGGWAGLDLGKPMRIEKIVFTPRNRDNFIRKGDQYELFYETRGAWISKGKRRADSDSVLYRVPKGALLYLKNHTRGTDERIFEYRNGKQMFW